MISFPIHPDVLERLKRQSERKLIVRHVRDPFAKVATDADLGRPDRREAIVPFEREYDDCECDGSVTCDACREREERLHWRRMMEVENE